MLAVAGVPGLFLSHHPSRCDQHGICFNSLGSKAHSAVIIIITLSSVIHVRRWGDDERAPVVMVSGGALGPLGGGSILRQQLRESLRQARSFTSHIMELYQPPPLILRNPARMTPSCGPALDRNQLCRKSSQSALHSCTR